MLYCCGYQTKHDLNIILQHMYELVCILDTSIRYRCWYVKYNTLIVFYIAIKCCILVLTVQRKNSTRCLTTVYMIVFEKGCNVTRHFLLSMAKSTEKLETKYIVQKFKNVQEENSCFYTSQASKCWQDVVQDHQKCNANPVLLRQKLLEP